MFLIAILLLMFTKILNLYLTKKLSKIFFYICDLCLRFVFSTGCERLPSQTHEKIRIARDVQSGQSTRMAYTSSKLP